MTSSAFRKRYAALTEPTLVTATGRVIGLWTPGSQMPTGEPLQRMIEALTEAHGPIAGLSRPKRT
jgi:hypothetical protein